MSGIGLCLMLSLCLRPWRQLAHAELWTPLLASLVLLPWLWALPRLHAMPLQLQLSGAVLVLLSVMAAEATALAVVDAVLHAQSVQTLSGQLPAAGTVPA